jgi:hypothetical protein
MKNQPEADRLLDDIFGENISPDFKNDVLDQTLRRVRRRKSMRRVNRGVIVLALFVCLPLAVWRWPVRPPQPLRSSMLGYGLVNSKPLDPSMIVESKADGLNVITSSPSTVVVIESIPGQDLFQEIDDQQLLTLLAGRPAALVRQGPQAELVFLNPADADGFFMP